MTNYCILAVAITFSLTVGLAQGAGSQTDLNSSVEVGKNPSTLFECGEKRIAFDGKCREFKFFGRLAAPNYTVVSADGCRKPRNKCAEVVSITEVSSSGSLRSVILGLPADPAKFEGSVDVKKPRSELNTVSDQSSDTPSVSDSNETVVRKRKRYPVISRLIQESSASDDGFELSMRAYLFGPGGTSPRVSSESVFEMSEPNIANDGSWSAELNGSYCSEDGTWPVGRAMGMSEDCDSTSCVYSHVFCSDEQQSHDSTSFVDCPTTGNPGMFLEFSRAFTDNTGLTCREGTGYIGEATPVASGEGGATTATYSACDTEYKIAVDVSNGFCQAAVAGAAISSGLLNAIGEIEWGVSGGFPSGVSISGKGTIKGLVTGLADSIIEGAAYTAGTATGYGICNKLGAMGGGAVAAVIGCAGGACSGGHQGVPVTIKAEDNDGNEWVCEGTADLSCGSQNSGSELGDADCSCSADSQSWNVTECRPAG